MGLSAFSARVFYQNTTGSPVDPAHAQVTISDSRPNLGLITIYDSPDGDRHDVWRRGVVQHSHRHAEFLKQIRKGRIPRPFWTNVGEESLSNIRYISIPQLLNSAQSVASILHLSENLAQTACNSSLTLCPLCRQDTPLFHSPLELSQKIQEDWGGVEIEVGLAGPHYSLKPWAETNGFTPRELSPGISLAWIDSLHCTPPRSEGLTGLLQSSQQVRGSWFVVSSVSRSQEYAWGGRCSACNVTMRSPQVGLVRETLDSGENASNVQELNLKIGDYALREVLTYPLAELSKFIFFRDLFSEPQLDYLEKLHLGEISLSHLSSSLPLHKLTALTFLSLLGKHNESSCPVVIEAPSGQIPDNLRNHLVDIASSIGSERSVVWLTDTPLRAPEHQSASIQGQTRTLATLHLSTCTPRAIRADLGRHSFAPTTTEDGASRLGLEIAKAMSGLSSRGASWDNHASASLEFIPLFPSKLSKTKLVAHQLNLTQALAKLFASSHQAKALGLSPKDLTLSELRQPHGVCSLCKGGGVIFEIQNGCIDNLLPCSSCWGTRFRAPLNDITFRGRTLWQVFNSPLGSLLETLRTLPHTSILTELIHHLDLQGVICGIPVALLSPAQQRLVAIVSSILESSPARPKVLVVEEPFTGLTERQAEGLWETFSLPGLSQRLSWILLCAA